MRARKLKLGLLLIFALILSTNVLPVSSLEGYDSTAAEEEGYWYSRYNFGSLAMMSGLGETFMPDMDMMMMAMQMADADFDPMQMGTEYGDGNHPIAPVNPQMIQAVYKSGDPHLTQMMNMDDFSTMTWDPSTFDTTLTGLSQGWTMIKLVEWAKQFHVDDHFGTPADDFGAQWRFMGLVLMMQADMQAMYFHENMNMFDLSDGGDYVMLWALSDLGATRGAQTLENSESNRYMNSESSTMWLNAADTLYTQIKDENPQTIKETSTAIQSLVWYSANTQNDENKLSALVKIENLAENLEKMNPNNAAETAYVLRGLVEAKRTIGYSKDRIEQLTPVLLGDFNDDTGLFDMQNTYTIDDVAVIVGSLNALRIFEGANVDTERAEEIFTLFYETVLNIAGMQQAVPPLSFMKDPFEYEEDPLLYFMYPGMPMPPMAGGEFGIAPVFASSVSYNDDVWSIDRIFDSAGAMHAANEFIWLHYDEINGFPEVDLSSTLVQAQESVDQVVDLTEENEDLEASKSLLESEVQSLETEVSSLESEVTSLESDVSGLEADAADLMGDVSSLESQVSSLEADVADLQGKSGSTTNYIIGAVIGLIIGAVAVYFLTKK